MNARLLKTRDQRLRSRAIRDVAAAWDANALARQRDVVTTGTDVHYSSLLDHYEAASHHAMALAQGDRPQNAIDVGCGVGLSTSRLRRLGLTVTGIDPSGKSLALAQLNSPGPYVCDSFDATTAKNWPSQVDFAGLLMSIHCCPELDDAASSLATVLRPGGVSVIVMPHPFLYLSHKAYFKELDYDYLIEACYWVPFKVRNAVEHPRKVPYYHRPMSRYYDAFERANLSVLTLIEPAVRRGDPLDDVLTLILRRNP